jgi:periplasmic divalent cation tolerance protein
MFLVFYTTHPDEPAAQRIVTALLERRLIACANIFPIQSQYLWHEAIQNEQEWVAILKSSLRLEAVLEKAISELHPYEVPCILRFEVRANAAYEQWIEESTSQA